MENEELLSIKTNLENLIVPHLPKNYKAKLRECDYFCLDVSGKITTDQNRPNKPAKPIEITISKEKLDDYAEAPKSSKKSFDQRLIEYIKTKTANFKPDHEVPYDQSVPAEKWHILVEMTY